MTQLRPLRDYQDVALGSVVNAFEQGINRIMLQAPCGFGKTQTAAHLIDWYLERDKKVVFVAPRLTLIDQVVDAFEAEGFAGRIGVIQGSHHMTDWDQPLQVASLQTLTRRKTPDFDLAIVDEAHMTSEKFLRWIREAKDMQVLGLSATPWRPGLGKDYDHLIIAETTKGLIEKGYLTDFTVYAPTMPDLTKVRTTAGEYNQMDLSKAVNKTAIIGDLVIHYQKLGNNRPAICFCVDREHAKHVQQRFSEAGIVTGYVDCFTDEQDRRDLIQNFRNGSVQVICNVGVLTTGFDAPEAACMIDAAPTQSLILHVQKTGRVLRTAPGKKDALILDHAGNTIRHGIVKDINITSMCDGSAESRAKRKKKEKTELGPRVCKSCSAVMAYSDQQCPQCGTPVRKYTTLIHIDDELQKIGSVKIVDHKIVAELMKNFFAEVSYIAREKGYRDGWAAYKFKERFGDWPNKLGVDTRIMVRRPPSLETLNYVRSKNIAYAKAQLKGNVGEKA